MDERERSKEKENKEQMGAVDIFPVPTQQNKATALSHSVLKTQISNDHFSLVHIQMNAAKNLLSTN